jgi:site-specific DNA recombinase
MLPKKAIKYLRFSHDKQSFHSIERQDHITDQWLHFNKIELVDTFKDEGYTARTFDRPDIKQLFQFIHKNHKGIDFLVVSELTRFSRETGDAINMVKKIQSEYGIRIVSASRGAIYDCLDHNSFFMMGLEFLLGHSENIKRTGDINGGIYTAKAIKGLWIQGGPSPYGYQKEGAGEKRRLIIIETEASIVRYIYHAYLANEPLYIISRKVKELGFNRTGRSALHDILANPIYYGYQLVKPWREQPGGLFPLAEHEPIIDALTWKRVQEKLNAGNKKYRIIQDDNFPLRGVLRCHCYRYLTGAPSRSRNGNYYNYYKCPIKGHNNISAIKAHAQLQEILSYLSLPARMISEIQKESGRLLRSAQESTSERLKWLKKNLSEVQEQLHSIETKWVSNKIAFDTYNRWYSELKAKIVPLETEVNDLSNNKDELNSLLEKELHKLSDLNYLYQSADTTQKQQLLRLGFDSSLTYKNGFYRTTSILPIFSHNLLILKEKKLLEVVENKKTGHEVRSSGGKRSFFEP